MNAIDSKLADRPLPGTTTEPPVPRAQELGTGWSVLALFVCGALALATVGAFGADQIAANWVAGLVGGFFVVVGVVWARALFGLSTPVFATWLASLVGGLAGAGLIGLAYRPQANDGRPDDLVRVTEQVEGQLGLVILGLAVVAAILLSLRRLSSTADRR